MEAVVHSDAAVVGVARGASPVAASPVVVRLEASPVATEDVAVFQVAVVVGAAEVVKRRSLIKSELSNREEDQLILFFSKTSTAESP